jgi:hypothetical protein
MYFSREAMLDHIYAVIEAQASSIIDARILNSVYVMAVDDHVGIDDVLSELHLPNLPTPVTCRRFSTPLEAGISKYLDDDNDDDGDYDECKTSSFHFMVLNTTCTTAKQMFVKQCYILIVAPLLSI